jgi:hypothetical protein
MTYLPELLARILASHPLQDLRASGVLLHKRVHLVYIVVDYNVQPFLNRRVLGDLLCCEGFGHCECGCASGADADAIS